MRYKLLLILALLVLVPHARAQTACIVTQPGIAGEPCIYINSTTVGPSYLQIPSQSRSSSADL